jgi:tetratricopeptide (TPR) repeat protein
MKAGSKLRHLSARAAAIVALLGCSLFIFTPVAATLQGLQVGMAVPDFTVRSLTAGGQKLSGLLGDKLTVVVFWSNSSVKSEPLLKRLSEFYRTHQGRGLAVVAINTDELQVTPQTLARAGEAAVRLKLPFPVFVDEGLGAFHAAGVIALPTTIVLDRDRVIRYELAGYPLVGGEELFGFLSDSLDGTKTAAAPQKKSTVNKEALRHYHMGEKTLQAKRLADSAESWFEKAIAADPAFVQPYLRLGALYLRRGEVDLAKARFEQALAQEPANVVALCEMGMLLADAGETGKGLAMFDQALAADEAYTPCYYYRGTILQRLQQPEQAQQMFAAAIANNPRDHVAYVHKARAHEANGQLREAAAAYRRAVELVVNRERGDE